MTRDEKVKAYGEALPGRFLEAERREAMYHYEAGYLEAIEDVRRIIVENLMTQEDARLTLRSEAARQIKRLAKAS